MVYCTVHHLCSSVLCICALQQQLAQYKQASNGENDQLRRGLEIMQYMKSSKILKSPGVLRYKLPPRIVPASSFVPIKLRYNVQYSGRESNYTNSTLHESDDLHLNGKVRCSTGIVFPVLNAGATAPAVALGSRYLPQVSFYSWITLP